MLKSQTHCDLGAAQSPRACQDKFDVCVQTKFHRSSIPNQPKQSYADKSGIADTMFLTVPETPSCRLARTQG
jgi:hypothetical protein